ncbi:MAG: SIR2 family protein [Betaproteobacteria bacterium]
MADGMGRSGIGSDISLDFDALLEMLAAKYMVDGITTFPDQPARRDRDGVMHLHGRLPVSPGPIDPYALALSHADFGRADLTEAWAARFVASLMREFTIRFAGYRIEDTIVRYMTTAQIRSDDRPDLYVFCPLFGDPGTTSAQWEAKHVRPILRAPQAGSADTAR